MGAVASTNIVTDGLVACWDAGNRRCGTPSDGGTWNSLGVSAPAVLDNDAGFADVNMGVIALDGTDEKVTVANTTDIDGDGGFTFDIWLYFLDMDSAKYTVFSLYNSGGGAGEEFTFWIMDKDQHNYSVRCGKRTTTGGVGTNRRSNDAAAELSANIGKWANWTFTYSGGDSAVYSSYKIYYNGEEKDDGTMGGAGNGGEENATRWGLDRNGSGAFEGYIGRVALYNKELTAAQILQNYEATKPRFAPRITTDGLFASWDAGDPNSYSGGTTLKDTANNYDGTFVNNGSGGDISFDSANGGSLVFDGSDDYVNITTLPDYSGTARSAIIWFSVDDMDGGVYTPFQSAADQFCVSFGQYETGGTVWMAFRSENSGSNYTYGVSTTVSDGVWTCWAVTINASDEIVAVYQNGDSKSLTAGHGFTIKTGTTIGCRLDGSTIQNDLDGKIGSVRLYTKTLSAAEIMDNYQKTKGRFGH
tara:strand:- start:15436 stop:16857 length:1422 start_codon:yes stop_codon:yes gene_type:complete